MSKEPRADEPDLPASIQDDKVVAGRGGRLFLANDTNHVLDQHSGGMRFDEDQLRQWRLLLETRTAWLERRGSRHFFLIAPNAHSVYPDELPEGVPSAPERPVHQLLGNLRDNESYARVVYPLEALSGHEDAYPKTGSHWSPLGASLACRALVEQIRVELPVDGPSEDAFDFVPLTPFFGDLGAKMRPQMTSTFVQAVPRRARARRVSDNRVRNTGRRVVYEWDDPGAGPHCLVYGDSYAMRVLPFLTESFARLTFVHMVTLDFDLVRTLEPDVVVKIMNERFLIFVPQDAPAKTHEQLAAERIAAGEVLKPKKRDLLGRPLSQAG